MKILSRPKGNAEEYGRWAVNAYLGCQNRCKYCYLQTGPGAKTLGGDAAHMKSGIVSMEHACHLAMAEILENREQIIEQGGLFFTFTSDPLMFDTRNVNLTIAAWATLQDIPVTMLTKSASFYDYKDSSDPSSYYLPYIDRIRHSERRIPSPLIDLYSRHIALGWTLTGHDELEPRADRNLQRIEAMKDVAAAGFKTWASIEPVIEFRRSYRMIQQALDAGCQHFKIGLMTSRTKVCRKGFTLGGQEFRPYDAAECLAFVQDVMQMTRDRATVYWKQSFRELIGGTPAHRLFTDDELHKIFDDYPNAVGKDWTMFNI